MSTMTAEVMRPSRVAHAWSFWELESEDDRGVGPAVEGVSSLCRGVGLVRLGPGWHTGTFSGAPVWPHRSAG